MKQKAQVSMEYLAVYSFAVVIILGTVATFTYLSGNPENKIPSNCKFSSEVSCKDHEIVSGGVSAVQILNKDKKIYDVVLICDFLESITSSAPPIPSVERGELFTISCDTPSNIKSGDQVKIEAKLEYHLNLTTMRNPRYYHGTILEKAK